MWSSTIHWEDSFDITAKTMVKTMVFKCFIQPLQPFGQTVFRGGCAQALRVWCSSLVQKWLPEDGRRGDIDHSFLKKLFVSSHMFYTSFFFFCFLIKFQMLYKSSNCGWSKLTNWPRPEYVQTWHQAVPGGSSCALALLRGLGARDHPAAETSEIYDGFIWDFDLFGQQDGYIASS